MEYYFVNQYLEGAVQASLLSGKTENGSNTEAVMGNALMLIKKIVEQTRLRGVLLCQLIKDELEIICRIMANQNNLSRESVIRLIQKNCMACARQLLDLKKENILIHQKTGKDMTIADEDRYEFRCCCLSWLEVFRLVKPLMRGQILTG